MNDERLLAHIRVCLDQTKGLAVELRAVEDRLEVASPEEAVELIPRYEATALAIEKAGFAARESFEHLSPAARVALLETCEEKQIDEVILLGTSTRDRIASAQAEGAELYRASRTAAASGQVH